MNPGLRQPCHDLHYPGAYARPVGRADRLQGQQHRPRQAERVRLSIVPHQGNVGRYRLQPVQIPRIPTALLARHYRRSQRQRQRQVPQRGSNLSRSSLIVEASSPSQERRRLIGAEHIHRDGVS